MTATAYTTALGLLARRSDGLAVAVKHLEGEAAQRGHLTGVQRARDLAERLAVELAELQVTDQGLLEHQL